MAHKDLLTKVNSLLTRHALFFILRLKVILAVYKIPPADKIGSIVHTRTGRLKMNEVMMKTPSRRKIGYEEKIGQLCHED